MPQETAHACFRSLRCGNRQCPMAMSSRQSPVTPGQCPVAPVLHQTRHSVSPPCHASALPTAIPFSCAPLLCTSWALALEKPKLPCFTAVGNTPSPRGRCCFLSSTHVWPTARPWPRVGLVTMFPPAFPISSCLPCCLQSRQEDETLGFSPKTSSTLMLWVISCVKVHMF